MLRPFPSTPRARLLALGAVAASALVAAPTAGAAGTRQFSGIANLECQDLTATDTANPVAVTLSGTSPAFVSPGERFGLPGVNVAVRTYDRTTFDGTNPFLNGRLTGITVALEGAAGPGTVAIPLDAAFSASHVSDPVYGGAGWGPLTGSFSLPEVAAGDGPVSLKVTKLTFTAERSATSGAASGAAHAISCTPIPSSTDPLLYLPSAAGATGAQVIDTTVPMTCGPSEEVIVGVKAIVPATTKPGGAIPVAAASYTLTKLDGTTVPTAPYIWGAFQGIIISADGASANTEVNQGGGYFSPSAATAHRPGGYGPFPLRFYSQFPPVKSAIAGSGAVTLRLSGFSYGFSATSSPEAPIQPFVPMGITCVPKDGQGKLATVAAEGTPATNVPVVSRVYGNAWAGFGGLIRVHGSRLNGTKFVQIGAKKVRPLVVIGSTDVWVLAPALAKGTYPVVVGNGTAVSLPGTGSATTLTYR